MKKKFIATYSLKQFADFLVKCNVVGVCSLQSGINALRSKSPNIIVPAAR